MWHTRKLQRLFSWAAAQPVVFAAAEAATKTIYLWLAPGSHGVAANG